jgi:hypothetical protein
MLSTIGKNVFRKAFVKGQYNFVHFLDKSNFIKAKQ